MGGRLYRSFALIGGGFINATPTVSLDVLAAADHQFTEWPGSQKLFRSLYRRPEMGHRRWARGRRKYNIRPALMPRFRA